MFSLRLIISHHKGKTSVYLPMPHQFVFLVLLLGTGAVSALGECQRMPLHLILSDGSFPRLGTWPITTQQNT